MIIALVGVALLYAAAWAVRAVIADVARHHRTVWSPLVEDLGGTGNGVHSVVELDGHELQLVAVELMSSPFVTKEVTQVRVAMPDHPITIRPRFPGEGAGRRSTGDAAFDQVYLFDGPEEAVAWFTADVRRRMLRDGDVSLKDGELQITLDGYVDDLDRLHSVLVDAARLGTALAWDPTQTAAKRAESVRDPLPAVRERNLRLLLEHHPEKVAQVAPLSDPDPTVRTLAAGWLDAPEVLLDVLASVDCPSSTRADALECLAASTALHEAMTPRLADGLLRLADSPHRETRRVALECMGRSGGPEMAAPLRTRAADAGWFSSRRRQTQAALARLLERHQDHRGGVALAQATGAVSLATTG